MTTSPQQDSRNRTEVVVLEEVPGVRITRDFDAPVERVFRAWTDPDQFRRWIGPRDLDTAIEHWEARTGGSWRYAARRHGEEIARFYGSFHEVRPNERLVQTFTWEGAPDGVSLEVLTLEDLGNGRTRTVGLSVLQSFEERDAMIASGMETGVVEGFEKLDELLTEG